MTQNDTTLIQLDESADGQQVTVPAGQEFQISLAETPTTGYRWIFVSTGSPVAEPIQDQFQSPSGGAGQPGSHLWVFRAGQRGHVSIELQCVRSWETGVPPLRTFTVDVEVE